MKAGAAGLAQGLVGLSLLAGCIAAPAPTTSNSSEATSVPSPSTTAPPPVPAEHAIGVRVVDGEGEFFDRRTGEAFVPRGANLIRLAGGRHSTLDVSRYDPDGIDQTFAEMAAAGFNTVRIFLNSFSGGMPGEDASLSDAYLDNSVDVLQRAKAQGLHVLFTQDWLPESPAWSFASDPLIENVNSMYLSRAGMETNRRFFGEWAAGLVARNAPLDALLAYELRNELYFTELFPPFSLDSGTVTTANGETYDLSLEGEKRRLLEDNLVFWIDEMRRTILQVDPTALVTVGFFQPKGPNTSRVGDDRLVETRETILRSFADFIDLHGYPGGELSLAQLVENFALPPVTEKPVLLGEFGAERSAFPSVDDAVRALVEWQVESCEFGVDGWLLWTWDSIEQPEFWNGQDEDGAIVQALSPSLRPDPCVLGDLGLAVELAREATVVATAAEAGAAELAIDGLPGTIWNAGEGAPQWIEMDLGSEWTIEAIRLLVAQYPSGATTHVVSVSGESGEREFVATIDQQSADGDWLEVTLPQPLDGVRYVRIETTKSPSWVAWREISVLGVSSD